MNSARVAATSARSETQKSQVTPARCPACGRSTECERLEIFRNTSLYACAGCDLHFWHPVKMPDASWYETAYQGRDRTAMPLEPGHRFFLSDPRAPKRGRLLDLGCGVGNFLAAARDAGFEVTGIEINQNAVRYAQEHYGLRNVCAMHPEEFHLAWPDNKFEVVAFFEVLEHQEDPQGFLQTAKKFLAPGGWIALSVPNRDRWQQGIETLDYPPNHLTRWSRRALGNLLERNGFEIISMRAEPLGISRAAQVLSMGMRTGLAAHLSGEPPPTLADLAEMNSKEMEEAMTRLANHPGHRLAARLVRWKNLALVPAAALLLPYLRLRGYTGLYLYCLARQKDASGWSGSKKDVDA